jgi:serine protease inhibitor ecotin
MKIDVETYEAEALQGMEEFLGTMKPTLLIEILTRDLGERLEQLLARKGYNYYAIDEIRGPAKVDNLYAEPCRNFLICPAEKGDVLGLPT